ncbi:MAG: pyridoxamine 5'-phosphate oxidase family protein [Alistipes sp.]|nr:pyridoxamine 5'-phosphate oxidase family protein [Alistipes sp.]
MFREMRRRRQLLDPEESEAILRKMTCGTLALAGDDGYPYAVPVSYVFTGGRIYFHSAKAGHKIDALARNEKVSFCVVEQDRIVPAEFTTYFRSVIVFGRARIVTDGDERRAALEMLGAKYAPGDPQGLRREIEKDGDRLHLVAIEVEHMTGKEAIELANPPRGRS